MSEKQTIRLKRFLIRFFCVLFTLIFLVKAESTLYAPAEFCYYSPPTKTELLVTPASDVSLFKVDVPSKQSVDYILAHVDFACRYKPTLFYFDNYVRHLLRYFDRTFLINRTLVSILQKHNIWHHSSDEEPIARFVELFFTNSECAHSNLDRRIMPCCTKIKQSQRKDLSLSSFS